jgi:hypothetical protein
MRPQLVEFYEDGSIYIDASIYSMEEMKALVDSHGKPYVELLVRLYAYRTPINPFEEEEKRIERGIADTIRRRQNVKIERYRLNHRNWQAAIERFCEERYDVLFERFCALEQKIVEFNNAIKNTPVMEVVKTPLKQKAPPKRGRRKKSDAVSEEDIDGIIDEMMAEPEYTERHVDNTDALAKMNKTLREYMDQYEETRQQLLRIKKGKSQLPQTAADFRKRQRNY